MLTLYPFKQIIIIGAGPSMNEGISKDLWSRISDKITIGCNSAFKFFNSTFVAFVDFEQFYKLFYDELRSLPLLIGRKSGKIDAVRLPNTILLKESSTYSREFNGSIYSGFLTGAWALTLATYLIQEGGDIFLLGYDFGDNGNKDEKGRQITHFYQGQLEHSGVGRVGFYQHLKSVNRFFGVYPRDINIFNVSLNSNIGVFPKISYDEFFSRLNTDTYNQDVSREIIRERFINVEH